jgi:hypothetical protein
MKKNKIKNLNESIIKNITKIVNHFFYTYFFNAFNIDNYYY